MKTSRFIPVIVFLLFFFPGCGRGEIITESASEEETGPTWEQLMEEEVPRRKIYDFLDVSVPVQSMVFDCISVPFEISADFTEGDQYNSNICDIRAFLTTPSGGQEEAPGFYKQNETPRWAFRYNPREPGMYHFYLEDVFSGVRSEEYKLDVIVGSREQRGFISIEGNKFKDSFNRQFTILGTNFAWGTEDEFARALPLYGEYGLNYIRFWSQCDWSVFSLESAPGTYLEGGRELTFGGLGDYNLESAARMDWLLDLFEENGVYMQFCLFNFWDFYKGHWERNAYNKENGGPCYWTDNHTDFWTDPVALKYQKQLIRYIYSRFGASRSFAVLELWNECDNKVDQKKRSIRDDWHRSMYDYWRSLDIYHHPVTTSYAWKDHPAHNDEFNGADPWKSQGFLDFANPHSYISPGTDPVTGWIEQLVYTQQQHPGEKPVFIGEFSEKDGEFSKLSEARERYFSLGIWAPIFFADGAGSNLHWRVDAEFLPSLAMFESIRRASDIIGPFEENLLVMEHVSPAVKKGLQTGYYKGEDQCIGFIRDSKTPYDCEEPPVVKGESITISTMIKGDYKLCFYDLYTGGSRDETVPVAGDGLLTVPLPDFSRDLVFTAVRQKRIGY